MRLLLKIMSNRNHEYKVAFSSFIVLSLCLSLGSFTTSIRSTFAQSDDTVTAITLASTEPRFFDCGATSLNGTTFSPQLGKAGSASFVLTDRDLDTILMGNATFDVTSTRNGSIVNIPGPDLMVVEMAGAELVNISVSHPEIGSKWITQLPSASNDTNNCDYTMNQLLVDLSSFGIPEGSAVSSIRIDNMGAPDSMLGSDIAEIFVLESGPTGADQFSDQNGANQSPDQDGGNIPFLVQ